MSRQGYTGGGVQYARSRQDTGEQRARAKRPLAISAIVFFLFSILMTYAVAPVTVLGAHGVGLFELDGNADDQAAAGADWENGPEGAADDFFAGAATEAEANDTTYFTTGGSKDENNIPSWAITTTGSPDKDELTDAYAAVYQLQGDTWVYFGADRFDNDGTAQIGFWFFQNEIGIKNGDFTGTHHDGDVLIISEYTNGGVVSTICAYEWDGSGGGDNINNAAGCDPATNNSNLNLVASGAQCDAGDGTFDICAVTNDGTENAPWSFTNKDGDHNFGPGQFFEGGFNLSDMFGGQAPCFGTFLAETRTSAETDAQLKDFALGDFDTCVPPTITTQSSNSTRDFGQQVSDTATLSGSNGAVTGKVDFFICKPSEVTAGGCVGDAGTKVLPQATVQNGQATSGAYTVGLTAADAGKYCWRAEYTPDDASQYLAGSHTNSTNECFTVAPATIKVEKTANPAGPVIVGGVIGFDIKVTNTGDGTALGVNVTDNLPAGIVWATDAPTGDNAGVSCSIDTAPNPDVLTCTDASLPSKGSWTVHIHGTTDAGDCGTINNRADVGTTNDGSDHDFDSVLVGCPALSIDKVDNTGSYDAVDQVIHYSIKVTNTGNVTLHDVVVSDPKASNLQCTPATPLASLAVGAEINCTAEHKVTQADLDAGHFANTACTDDGNGDGQTGAAPVCDAVDTPGEQNPELSIIKSDGDATYSKVGDVIQYTIKAWNSGNVTLHDVVVTDPKAANLVCVPATPVDDLAPGAEINCTAQHVVTQADIDAGSYLNTACVDDAMGAAGTGADKACDDENTPGSQNPALSIVKVDNTGSYDAVDQVISYTITVKNIGNVTLHNVVVTDPNAPNVVCTPATPVASLAPNASFTCSASHTVTQADLDAGHYANEACADDGNGDGQTGAAPVCDDVDTPGEQNPALSIDKVDNTGSYDAVDQVIHYSIKVTNTGNVTLHDVVVSDPKASNLQCTPATPLASLAVGAEINCTAEHKVTQADLDAGHFANTACTDDGNGDGQTGAAPVCDAVDTPGEQNPELSIIKSDGDATYSKVGDVIQYTIKAWNSGNVTLHDVVVTDPKAANLVCVPATPVDDLAPGAEINCTAQHVVTQADIDAGSYLNTACVDDAMGAAGTGADKACDDENTPGSQNPALSIVKSDGDATYDEVGDVIVYSIVVTNVGNVTLNNVEVTDPKAVGLDCSADSGIQTVIPSLAVGASFECSASHVVTQEDLDNGTYLNTACADDSGNAAKVCDDEDTPGEQSPELSITKVATEESFDSVNDVVHYTITAWNSGNVTLHGVVVTDPNAPDISCIPATPVTNLAPGEQIVCTASHTITQDDLDAGHYFNEACADDTEGPAVEVCANVDTHGEQNPALAIDKQVTEGQYTKVGQVLHYTIKVTNVGDVTLHDVVVTDPKVQDLECTPALPVATLEVGASFTCTATHTIVQADLDAGFFTNVACADDEMGQPEMGAAPVCDNVTNFGQEVKEETNPPTQPNTAADNLGAPSSPSNGSWLLILAFATLLASVVLATPRRGRQPR